MADTEMAEFLRVNGIGGVALEPLVEERLTRAAHSQRTAGDVFAEESVQVRLANCFRPAGPQALFCSGKEREVCRSACLVRSRRILLDNIKVPGLAFSCMHRSQSLLYTFCRAALPSECLSVPPQAPLQPARLFGALRAAVLLCGSALSCCVAACGVALLLFLLVTRTLAPAAAHFQRDLYFDYTSPDVVAVASFLFTGAAASEPPFVKARRCRQAAAV